MPLFDEIRSASAAVMARARFVCIDEERLCALAAELAEAGSLAGALDPAHHHLGSPESTLAYVVVLDALNFGSGWFPHLKKRAGASGYFTVAGALKDHFEREGPPSSHELRAMTVDRCLAIFDQDPDSPEVRALMVHFARALVDLGAFLDERFGGSFVGLIASANESAETLAQLLAEMPLYRDVSRYEDFDVPFYKRAQLTSADLSLAFEGTGYGAFRDLDRLTIFADNLVPHVLRREGVLHYDAELLARIDAEVLIPLGSPEEVELRAGALHAVERMCAVLADRGKHVSAQTLDYRLWNRGQDPRIKAQPRHRTRCTFY